MVILLGNAYGFAINTFIFSAKLVESNSNDFSVTIWKINNSNTHIILPNISRSMILLILPNISRSKGNQSMKLGQLIEYNVINIFLEKSYTKCGVETILGLVSKKSKLSISLDQ